MTGHPPPNPLAALLAQGTVILDGGLATTLEAHGHNLNDPLWSARLLLDHPEAIQRVHAEFLEAGADIIVTATYQATLQGLMDRGLSDPEAREVLRGAVQLAREARDAWRSKLKNHHPPLVAASVGPYGAYLADGSEYTGSYGLTEQELYDFHAPRFAILADAGADLLACETIPSLPEIRALLSLLGEHPRTWSWISLCCDDRLRLHDGTPVTEVVTLINGSSQVAAIAINCTSPNQIGPLLETIVPLSVHPVLVYPNSGEHYDPVEKHWTGSPGPDLGAQAREWRRLGAAGIGGCCRVGPGDIAIIRTALAQSDG